MLKYSRLVQTMRLKTEFAFVFKFSPKYVRPVGKYLNHVFLLEKKSTHYVYFHSKIYVRKLNRKNSIFRTSYGEHSLPNFSMSRKCLGKIVQNNFIITKIQLHRDDNNFLKKKKKKKRYPEILLRLSIREMRIISKPSRKKSLTNEKRDKNDFNILFRFLTGIFGVFIIF